MELIEKNLIGKGPVLDICSGLGTHSICMAKKGFHVHGIDISPTAVEEARKRCGKAKVQCNLKVGNSSRLDYPDGFFTFVFDRGCFHHVKPENRDEFIKGIHRVLKEKGKYFMICFSFRNGDSWNHFTREQIKEYLSPYFDIRHIKEGTYIEPPTGRTVYFLKNLMEKK